VQRGEPPIHARKAVDIDQIAKIEETAAPSTSSRRNAPVEPSMWSHPLGRHADRTGRLLDRGHLIFIVVTFTRE